MNLKLITDRDNYHSDVLELRNQWLGDLLFYLGIDTNHMENLPRDIAIEYLIENDVEVLEYNSIKALEIRFEGQVVGEWGGPELKLVEEDGKIYFQADIECWSIIEEEIDV